MTMKRPIPRVGQALLCLLACAHAKSYADPMRPLILPPSQAISGTPAAEPRLAVARQAKAADGDTARPLERLVAIRLDGVRRWQALVGERWLSVGDKLDAYTVTAIEANALQLSEGRQRKTIYLLPPLWRPGQNAAPLAGLPPDAGTEVAQVGATAQSPHRATGLPSP